MHEQSSELYGLKANYLQHIIGGAKVCIESAFRVGGDQTRGVPVLPHVLPLLVSGNVMIV